MGAEAEAVERAVADVGRELRLLRLPATGVTPQVEMARAAMWLFLVLRRLRLPLEQVDVEGAGVVEAVAADAAVLRRRRFPKHLKARFLPNSARCRRWGICGPRKSPAMRFTTRVNFPARTVPSASS